MQHFNLGLSALTLSSTAVAAIRCKPALPAKAGTAQGQYTRPQRASAAIRLLFSEGFFF